MNVTEKPAQVCAQTESLEQVKQRFGRWRERHKRGAHIPRPLWAAAVALAKEHGSKRIARGLWVKYNMLNKQLAGADNPLRAVVGEARFVELLAPKAVGICECVVELENARGAKMRIQLNGGDIAGSLASLSSAFWSA